MNDDMQGKELPLTRKAIECADQQERLSYARVAAEMIKKSDRQQKDLAEMAGVTARSLRNLVQGKVIPQGDKLVAIFRALDVDVDENATAGIRPYISILSPIVSLIHPTYRDEAMGKVATVLSEFAAEHPAHRDIAHLASYRNRVGAVKQDQDQHQDWEVAGDSDIDHSGDTDDYDA